MLKLKTTRKRIVKMGINRFLKWFEFTSDIEKWSFVDDIELIFTEYLDDATLIKEVFNEIFKDRKIVKTVIDTSNTSDNNGSN